MFLKYFSCNLANQGLPIWWWYRSVVCYFLTGKSRLALYMSRVKLRPYFCAWTASNMSNALLRFRPLSLAILIFNFSTTGQPSFFPDFAKTSQISASVGAGTRTSNVLDRIGAMMLAVESAKRINLRFGEYFSMVLLNAACASLVKWSASLMTTTLNFCLAD